MSGASPRSASPTSPRAIVLDRDKLGEAVLLVTAGADITDAFIKDYNAKTKPKSGRK